METKPIVQTLIVALASINLLMTLLVLVRLRQPISMVFWVFKVLVSALSPLLLVFGLLIATLGIIIDQIALLVLGGISALLYLIHTLNVTRAPESSEDFNQTFGVDWRNRIPLERKAYFLSKRYVLRLPKSSEPIFGQNIPLYTLPNTDRKLLCDIWQPAEHIKRSGLAFIYLHGCAWNLWDKDVGTRTLFRHLVQQGHVVMDVGYRLFPKTGFMGIVHDAQHAIVWMKSNSANYGIDPENVVIGGGSAGGHIALLAAYTARKKLWTLTWQIAA